MSNPPTLPPSALSKAQANARIDQIAVRLINVPEGLRSNSTSVRINGTVERQNPDGSLDVATDRGAVRILLRDRGNLPAGSKIDIDIPAGRSPQQATIRQSQTETSTPQPPSLTRIANLEDVPIPPSNALPGNTKLNTDTLGSVITSPQLQVTDDALPPIPVAGGALQAGQMLRLLPLPPAGLPQSVLDTLATPLPATEMISGLVSLIETLPKDQSTLRAPLITLLSRLDLSALTPSPPKPAFPTATLQPQTQLAGRITNLLQSIGLPSPFPSDTAAPQAPLPQTAPPQTSTPLTLYNPSKPIDGQVIGFQPTPTTDAAQPHITISPQLVTTPSQPNTPIAAAQVLGFTDTKMPVLSVPLPQTGLTQLYTLQFKADNLTAGAPVFIALDPLTTRPSQTIFIQTPTGLTALDPATPPAQLTNILAQWAKADTWDSLDLTLKTLLHAAPDQAQALAQMMPSPSQPQHMGALSLFFLSLLRSGSPDNLMASETMTLLRQMGKGDLLRAVTTDMTLSAKMDGLALPQDWRMTMLPLLWEQNIQRTPLYYKHFPDDKDADGEATKKRRKLRFLFDLNLSRMGGVQVDGFMQSERLDIILRTKSPLSVPMQSQMKRIYAGAMDKSRLTGDLSFQFKPEHWVDFSKPFEKMGLNA